MRTVLWEVYDKELKKMVPTINDTAGTAYKGKESSITEISSKRTDWIGFFDALSVLEGEVDGDQPAFFGPLITYYSERKIPNYAALA